MTSGPDFPIALGDFVTINTGRGTARLNGTQSRTALLQGPQWFLLQRGRNVVRYIATASEGVTEQTAPRITGYAYPAWR